MAIDPYASCPCGSGKKFKWCCQPIHADIEKAFEQFNAGQHEAAYKAMEAIVAANSANPEAYGRQAQLLALSGKAELADAALEKAFAINPNYGFGYLLRGQFRLQEGEIIGALLLFRKAADSYGAEASDQLAYSYELIADIEMRLNHPLAAAAAFRRAIHVVPASAEIRQTYDALFGDKSRLPRCARKEYTFRAPANPTAEWNQILEKATSGRFSDIRDAFTTWTTANPDEPAGWFNLGLARAWLGDNVGAMAALTKNLELDSDESRGEESAAIIEVLRCGDGLTDECDYAEHRAVFGVRDPQAMMALIESWAPKHRLIGLRADPEQGLLTGLLLEPPTSLVETADVPTFAKLRAYFLIAGNTLQMWTADVKALDAAIEEVTKGLGATASPPQKMAGPIMFPDVVTPAMLFPTKQTTELDAGAHVRDAAANYFEEKWLHQPLKSLSGIAPIDAAGSSSLRKKLRGVVRFIQDCGAITSVQLYDFDRLRRKLGLLEGGAADAAGESKDIGSMAAAELAALDLGTLNANSLGEAYRAAIKLDAKELAGKFAAKLVEQPASAGDDRFPFYNHLINLAQADKNWDEAVNLVEAAEKADCEHNEGRRRNDYELRRGQLLAKRGDGASAADVFERLIARQPDELKYLEAATKAMLDLKNPKAATFAEQGLTKARAQNNRDAEEYFLELNDAAKRLR